MLHGEDGFVIVDFNLVAKKLSQLFLLIKLWILEKNPKNSENLHTYLNIFMDLGKNDKNSQKKFWMLIIDILCSFSNKKILTVKNFLVSFYNFSWGLWSKRINYKKFQNF